MSKISYNRAMKLWRDVYGDKTYALDCFGTWMCREDYGKISNWRSDHMGGNKQYDYGWSIDHILPIAEGGNDDDNNLEPIHHLNNSAKGNLISFKIRNISYQVVKISKDNYGIKEQISGKMIDWKSTTGKFYK